VPCCTRTTPLVATAMFCPGAFGFAEDEEAADDVSDDEDKSELDGLAEATHGDAVSPAPIPNATANAPTRPIYLAEPVVR